MRYFCFLVSLVFLSCTVQNKPLDEVLPAVKLLKPIELEEAGILEGFGSLVFDKKITIASPLDGILITLVPKEGSTVLRGSLVAQVENKQVEYARARAEASVNQALSAVLLAESQERTQKLAAEARILSLDKAKANHVQSNLDFNEMERKFRDQEKLYKAGGVPEEQYRTSLFSLEKARESLRLEKLELEIQSIGLRDKDIIARFGKVESLSEKKIDQLIALATEGAELEKKAAEARLVAAQKELESAQLAESELRIYARTTGIVGAVHKQVGERLAREEALVTLMDTGDLFAQVQVPEKDALLLKTGMLARVRVDATDEDYEARLDSIAPMADFQSASFMVRLRLSGARKDLTPGMFARIQIPLEERQNVLVVPEASLRTVQGRNATLFAYAGGVLRLIHVELGESRKEGRIIVSELDENVLLVDSPSPRLREGDRVALHD